MIRKNEYKRDTFHYFFKCSASLAVSSMRSVMSSNEYNELKSDNVIFPLDLFCHILSSIMNKLYFRDNTFFSLRKSHLVIHLVETIYN